MSHSEIFIYMGEVAFKFLLSLIGQSSDSLEPFIQSVFSFVLALIIWISIIKFILRLASKALGLDQQGRRQ